MHRLPRLVTSGHGLSAGGFQKGSHIVRQGPHCLQSLDIQRCLSGFTSIDYVPVLGGYNRHVHHLERHVESLESGRCTTPPADGYRCCGFALERGSVGIEHPLDNGKHGAVRLAPIDRSNEIISQMTLEEKVEMLHSKTDLY